MENKRMEIGKGIGLSVLTDSKFKTSSIIVNFVCPLREENASANAAAAFMIEDTCAKYPTVTALHRRLGELYGASVNTGISRHCDSQVITAAASCIADKYALNGEDISCLTAELLSDCVLDPATENGIFPEKQFGLKKQELIDDINADINDKRGYALKNTGKIVYRGEPAGIPVKGEKEAAEKLTAAEAFKAYKEMLRTARIEIFFVGCETSDKCIGLIKERFGELDRGDIYEPVNRHSPLKAAPEYKTDRLEIVQSKMVMAYKTDMDGCEVPRVFGALFGGTPFSMLFKNVREKLSLCYYCSASVNRIKGVIYVDSGVESANIEPAQKEIGRQLELIAEGRFSDEILEQTKLLLTCSLKSVEDSPRAAADWYFNGYLDGNVRTPEESAALINAVAREDVCSYAASMKLDTVYVLTGKED